MEPIHVFSEEEHDSLYRILAGITENPYHDYPGFSRSVAEVAAGNPLLPGLLDACSRMRYERSTGGPRTHVFRNCPLDQDLPVLTLEDSLTDRFTERNTFIGEAFVAFVAMVSGTPLLAYRGRNNGRFFDDVIAIPSHSGEQSAFSDGDLVYHNDRSAHWARPDLVLLLALRSPADQLVYTSYVDGRELRAHLSPLQQQVLQQRYFVTSFSGQPAGPEAHPIFEGESIRYVDTITTTAAVAPPAAKDALIAMKDALVLAAKQRHRLLTGDLLIVENQTGLHCRDRVEVRDEKRARTRWLLKVYSFRDDAAADRFEDRWFSGIRGLIAD